MTIATASLPVNWQALLASAQSNNPDAHNRFAQLATVQLGQEPRPAVRTVAVRFFLGDGRLLISSDMRNEKMAELAANPACELCWYFTQTREQFRISGRAQVVSAVEARLEAKLEGAMQRTWDARSAAAQQSYSWPQPKRRLDETKQFEHGVPAQPPDHFALILIEAVSVDYLTLATQPHQRVAFGKLGGQWMPRAINP
jgi:PPOX class probable FMN-dependent enzyme